MSLENDPRPGRKHGSAQEGGAGELRVDDPLFALVELFFFAYRDFTSDPDEILRELGFGRAHHRVLHFVSRNPGLPVADLLDILKITKQSLGRVLGQLIRTGYIEQRAGTSDRRQRLLHATAAGCELAARLAEPQLERVAGALAAAGNGSQAMTREFLYNLIDTDERERVRRLIAKP